MGYEAGMIRNQYCPRGLPLLSILAAAMDDFKNRNSVVGQKSKTDTGHGAKSEITVVSKSTGKTASNREKETSDSNKDENAIGDALEDDDDKRRSVQYDGQTTGESDVGNIEGLFIDIGAGLGFFSLGIAARGNKVLAFEPTGRESNLLQQS